MAFIIMTLSITVNETGHHAESRNAERQFLFMVMIIVVMLSVVAPTYNCNDFFVAVKKFYRIALPAAASDLQMFHKLLSAEVKFKALLPPLLPRYLPFPRLECLEIQYYLFFQLFFLLNINFRSYALIFIKRPLCIHPLPPPFPGIESA